MIAYHVWYTVKGTAYDKSVDVKDIKSAKKKLGKKHGYKDGRMINVTRVSVIGYYQKGKIYE